jgi:hypothetical protein
LIWFGFKLWYFRVNSGKLEYINIEIRKLDICLVTIKDNIKKVLELLLVEWIGFGFKVRGIKRIRERSSNTFLGLFRPDKIILILKCKSDFLF